MGHSAGGHLAMLYAYKNPTQIDLVISEAGPTDFLVKDSYGDLIPPDVNVCAMAGTTINDPDLTTKLTNASPLNYVTSSAPYTILAYGNGVGPKDGVTTYTGNVGDGVIAYSQATTLCTSLSSNGISYDLYELTGVEHTQFGEGSGKVVYPNVAIKEEDDTEVRALKTVIQNYYNRISRMIQELAEQED